MPTRIDPCGTPFSIVLDEVIVCDSNLDGSCMEEIFDEVEDVFDSVLL